MSARAMKRSGAADPATSGRSQRERGARPSPKARQYKRAVNKLTAALTAAGDAAFLVRWGGGADYDAQRAFSAIFVALLALARLVRVYATPEGRRIQELARALGNHPSPLPAEPEGAVAPEPLADRVHTGSIEGMEGSWRKLDMPDTPAGHARRAVARTLGILMRLLSTWHTPAGASLARALLAFDADPPSGAAGGVGPAAVLPPVASSPCNPPAAPPVATSFDRERLTLIDRAMGDTGVRAAPALTVSEVVDLQRQLMDLAAAALDAVRPFSQRSLGLVEARRIIREAYGKAGAILGLDPATLEGGA